MSTTYRVDSVEKRIGTEKEKIGKILAVSGQVEGAVRIVNGQSNVLLGKYIDDCHSSSCNSSSGGGTPCHGRNIVRAKKAARTE